MSPADREKLKRVLASCDEAGLVALSNVGLVRRAVRDLAAGGVSHEEGDAAVVVRGPDWTVTMPADGPTKATDSTTATGITRQILTATIHLRDTWAAGPAPVSDAGPPPGDALAEALMAVSVDDLRKWAGKTVVKDALALLAPPPAVEVEAGAGLAVRLVQHGVEARLFPGAGTKPAQLLDAVRTTAPKAHHVRWATVAVLAFQASRGKLPAADAPPPTVRSSSPADRDRVFASARDLFDAMVRVGLAHLSDRTAERLFTLSVSVTALRLPRLAHLIRSVADDVELGLGRHAAADPARLFERLCLADALVRALAASGDPPPARLAGRPRTEYDPAGDLTLAGVGAYPWQSASGFEGVTALFWDLAARRFLTWTASRPVSSPGRFSSDAAYRTEAVWRCGSAEQMCRTLLILHGGRVNPAGRLSAAKECVAETIEFTDPGRIDFGGRRFTGWDKLAAYASGTVPLGLGEPQPLDRVVVIRPAKWGERVFDESRQCLRWAVHDPAGRAVELVVPWAGVNESTVEFLEAVTPGRDRLTDVVARVGVGPAGFTLEPLSLLGAGTPHGGHKVLNPGFDRAKIASPNAALLERLRAKFGRDRVATTLGGDEDDDAHVRPDAPGVVGGRLREWDALLLGIAEAGVRRAEATADRRRELVGFFRRAGLGRLADPSAGEPTPAAADVLRLGYLAGLHRQALVAAGVGG